MGSMPTMQEAVDLLLTAEDVAAQAESQQGLGLGSFLTETGPICPLFA
jgi:hypothetical protein